MIAALGLLLSVSVSTPGASKGASISAAPQSHVMGKGIDCQGGYFALTVQLVRGGHYMQSPDSDGKLYTTYFSPDDHTVWRFTLEGNPAHPAVAVLNTGPKGVSLKGACGFGDDGAFTRFVNDFEITQAHRGQ